MALVGPPTPPQTIRVDSTEVLSTSMACPSALSAVVTVVTQTMSSLLSMTASWIESHRARATVLALAILCPVLALVQGAYFLSKYRERYGDAPVPLVPCRGIVVSTSKSDEEKEEEELAGGEWYDWWSEKGEGLEEWYEFIGSTRMDLGVASGNGDGSGRGNDSVNGGGGAGVLCGECSRTPAGRSEVVVDDDDDDDDDEWRDNDEDADAHDAEVDSIDGQNLSPRTPPPPIRLLVIGDSLAAGVGTSRSCAPVLPRVIASALSRHLGGRPVRWTCLGEPGASAGWIVRELESHPSLLSSSSSEVEEEGGPFADSSTDERNEGNDEKEQIEIAVHGDDDDIESIKDYTQEKDDSRNRRWKDGLDLPRRARRVLNELDLRIPSLTRSGETFFPRYDNDNDNDNDAGQYDVAVVLTGPNDLKFAVLPFMLRGDDVEFHRQSKRRGGSYAEELHRVMDALVDKMKGGLDRSMVVEKVRARVEESIERVRSTVESAMPDQGARERQDRMNVDEMLDMPTWTKKGETKDEMKEEEQEEEEEEEEEKETIESESDGAYSTDSEGSPTMEKSSEREPTSSLGARPLVVLAGLPARNLPVLRWLPLRWLALTLLSVVENVKRTLARRYPSSVLYVEAPDTSTMRDFELCRGPLWEGRSTERTVLSIVDKDARLCEETVRKMVEYYAERDEKIRPSRSSSSSSSSSSGSPPPQQQQQPTSTLESDTVRSGNAASESSQRPRFRPGSAGATLLSADKLHPNDLGYDFWGRLIAKAIVDEWKRDESKQ